MTDRRTSERTVTDTKAKPDPAPMLDAKEVVARFHAALMEGIRRARASEGRPPPRTLRELDLV